MTACWVTASKAQPSIIKIMYIEEQSYFIIFSCLISGMIFINTPIGLVLILISLFLFVQKMNR